MAFVFFSSFRAMWMETDCLGKKKNKISHRYKALLKLKEWLNTQP